ncbi:PH domain-containing protein [Bacillus sp. FJAT-49711]|nr:PH domain-containing protein [Bacillus sp. FJAT-49711]
MIKGGPYRRQIPYEKITKISSAAAIFTGHRINHQKMCLKLSIKQHLWEV